MFSHLLWDGATHVHRLQEGWTWGSESNFVSCSHSDNKQPPRMCRDALASGRHRGTTSQDEGESVETAVQPRNGKSPQAFTVSQLITPGKVISRPCKSFASVYPGTGVTLGCSSRGHRAVLQPPLTRAARGARKPCSNLHLCVGESMEKSPLLPPPHKWRTRLRTEFRPPHLRMGRARRREWAEAP